MGCSEREVLVPATGIGGQFDPGPRAQVDCSADDGYEFLVIEDFELGAASIAYTNNEVCYRCSQLVGDGLGGGAGSPEVDACRARCQESQFPTDFDKPLPAELIPGGRCSSRYALHLTGGPFTEWGGLVAFPFGPSIDARGYEGVSFWARVRSGARAEFRVAALDPETDASYVDPVTLSPLCDAATTIDRFSTGCDPYGAFVNSTLDWQFFRVPFEEMRQRGFGTRAGALNLEALRQIALEYGQGTWDLWIDDISLYRRGADL